jgi:hypothetical protein
LLLFCVLFLTYCLVQIYGSSSEENEWERIQIEESDLNNENENQCLLQEVNEIQGEKQLIETVDSDDEWSMISYKIVHPRPPGKTSQTH